MSLRCQLKSCHSLFLLFYFHVVSCHTIMSFNHSGIQPFILLSYGRTRQPARFFTLAFRCFPHSSCFSFSLMFPICPAFRFEFRSSCSFVLPDMFQILEVILDPFHLSRISSMFLFLLPPQLKTAKSWAKFPRKGRNRNRIGNHCACFFGNHEKLRNFRKILGETKSWKQKK